jgi:short-subunit dehydrogenase
VAKYGYKIMMKGKSYGVQGFWNKMVILSTRFSTRNMVTMISGMLLKSK